MSVQMEVRERRWRGRGDEDVYRADGGTTDDKEIVIIGRWTRTKKMLREKSRR